MCGEKEESTAAKEGLEQEWQGKYTEESDKKTGN